MPYAEIITDDGGPPLSPLRGYKRCLQAIPPSVRHLVVVQDDVVVASSFRERIERIAAERPNEVVILCVCGVRNRTCKWFLKALWAKEPYTNIAHGDYHHCIGVLWPKAKAEEFLAWMETYTKLTTSDDAAFGTWAMQTQQQVIACVPCIVQHDDTFKSVMRLVGQGGTARRAIAFSD